MARTKRAQERFKHRLKVKHRTHIDKDMLKAMWAQRDATMEENSNPLIYGGSKPREEN